MLRRVIQGSVEHDVMKFVFKYLDYGMGADKLSEHILQRLSKDDFEVADQKEIEYN